MSSPYSLCGRSWFEGDSQSGSALRPSGYHPPSALKREHARNTERPLWLSPSHVRCASYVISVKYAATVVVGSSTSCCQPPRRLPVPRSSVDRVRELERPSRPAPSKGLESPSSAWGSALQRASSAVQVPADARCHTSIAYVGPGGNPTP